MGNGGGTTTANNIQDFNENIIDMRLDRSEWRTNLEVAIENDDYLGEYFLRLGCVL